MIDSPPEETTDVEPYVDAADRLERVIDVQIRTLEGIDTKAEHVTRLIAGLLGVILTLLSVLARIDRVEAGSLPQPVALTVGAGIACLVLSMAAAIITYLSSKFKMGLHPKAGYLLSDADYETTADQHLRRVVGVYGHTIERNRRVIDANSRRFQLTLVLLLAGISYLSTGAGLYVVGVGGNVAWLVALLVTGSLGATARYVLSGGYLILQRQGPNNE